MHCFRDNQATILEDASRRRSWHTRVDTSCVDTSYTVCLKQHVAASEAWRAAYRVFDVGRTYFCFHYVRLSVCPSVPWLYLTIVCASILIRLQHIINRLLTYLLT